MLRASLNVSWREYMITEDIYNNIPRITRSIREQRILFVVHFWRSKNKLVSNVDIIMDTNMVDA